MSTLTAAQQRSFSKFDDLPASALIDAPVVAEVLNISLPSVWRLERTKHLPTAIRLTAGTTRWSVGSIRALLVDRVAASAGEPLPQCTQSRRAVARQ